MSQDASKVIVRQWNIIQFLLNGKYVSTNEIEKHLKKNGINTTQRTIQRDLNLLEGLFSLECRRDSMPYSWRWKKVEKSVKGLSMSQALILRLVDDQLKGVLPEHIKQELSPLFKQARLATTNIQLDEFPETLTTGITNRHPNVANNFTTSMLKNWKKTVANKIQSLYSSHVSEKNTKQSIKALCNLLVTYNMSEVATDLASHD